MGFKQLNNNFDIKWIFLLAIVLLIASSGCVDPTEVPPDIVVKLFASNPLNEKYDLMSNDYKNSVNQIEFENLVKSCQPSGIRKYEFVDVIDESEKIEGNSVSIEIKYIEKYSYSEEEHTRLIYLTNEQNGWRFKELYCELRK